MTWQHIAYFVSVIFTIAFMGYISGYAYRHRTVAAGAGTYAWVAGLACLMAVGEGFSLVSPSPEWALIFFKARFLPLAAIPVVWLVFVLDYTGQSQALSKRALIALCIIPAATQIMIWTNGLHGLWWKQAVGFYRAGPFFFADTAARVSGPWFAVHMLYTYTVMLTGVVLLFAGVRRIFRKDRGQALALGAGTSIMLLGSLIPVLNLFPGLRINPLIPSITLGSLFIAWGLFRHRFLAVTPGIDSTRRISPLLLILFSVGIVSIIASGYVSYRQTVANFREEASRQLSAIADLKVQEIVTWRRERLSDAMTLYQNDSFSVWAQRLYSNEVNEKDRQNLESWLSNIQFASDYSRIMLLDHLGTPYMSFPPSTEPVCPYALHEIKKIRKSEKIDFLDFHTTSLGHPEHLGTIVPIQFSDQKIGAIGFVVLTIDPESYLFPLLRRWPLPSATARTLLVRRKGNEALVLNETVSPQKAPFGMRIPLENNKSSVAAVVSGQKGFFEGLDHRGRKVIADLRAVPYSPWFLVCSMDMAEVYAPLKTRLWLLAALLMALLTSLVSGIALAWRRQQEHLLRERIAATEALHESKEKYRLLMETIRDIIVFHDMDGRIVYVNQAGLDLAGFSGSDVMGRSISDFLPGDQLADIVSRREKRTRDEIGEYLYESAFTNSSGQRIPVEVNSTPMFRDGKMIGILIVARDITERKQAAADQEKLQAQLRQSQKMESVGRLAGGVAHDFNNMLNVIIGNAELVRENMVPDDPLNEILQEILEAAGRSARVTQQLLAFARKQAIAPRKLDLNKTVEEMLKMLRRLIGENIDLAWRPKASLWPVRMDPTQINQMLANLLVNSRDAIGGVGQIIIETDNVRLDEDDCAEYPGLVPGEFVLLSVSDDGRGMDRETLDKLFEPFFTTKGVGEGTGLGLAMIYGIVKQNNGFIYVFSEPGPGATFKIYLPRHAGEIETVETKKTAEIPEARGETLLVVEDDASVLKLARRILTGLGYNVLAASTPTEALKLAGEHGAGIDLLITDVIMPEMNGKDLAERLQTLHPGLKVLFMSGYTADIIADQGILEKSVLLIQKPFNRENLAVKVREALKR